MAARAASVPLVQRVVLRLGDPAWLAGVEPNQRRPPRRHGMGWGPGQPSGQGWGEGITGGKREPRGRGRFKGTSPTLPTHRGKEVGGQSAGSTGSTGENREAGQTRSRERPRGRRRPGPDQSQGGRAVRRERAERRQRKVQ